MARIHVDVAVPALALRRAEAAAALGISTETFDEHVRPHVTTVRTGAVTTYPVAGLTDWLNRNAGVIAADLNRRRAA